MTGKRELISEGKRKEEKRIESVKECKMKGKRKGKETKGNMEKMEKVTVKIEHRGSQVVIITTAEGCK